MLRVEHLELEVEVVAQELANVSLVAPLERVADALRRRRGLERLHHPEDVADAAVLGPARQAEPAAGPGHPGELARHRGVIGREHDAEGRDDDVERRILVGQRLRVADVVLHRQSFLFRVVARGLDQVRSEVEPGDVGTGASSHAGDSSGPGRDVEPLLARLRLQRGDEALLRLGQQVRDPLVRAVAPHDALLGLQLFEHCPSPLLSSSSSALNAACRARAGSPSGSGRRCLPGGVR